MVSTETPRILITGVAGQIGTELCALLRNKYGPENVIATGRRKFVCEVDGPYFYLDVTDQEALKKLIVEQRIDWLIHNASVLSAAGEKNPYESLQANLAGIHNALEVSRMYGLRCFCPSTIGVFGPEAPAEQTPDDCVLKPTTIYGITKVHLELLTEYYFKKFGVDCRSLRYPGVISSVALPGGGTTDYAVSIFYDAIRKGSYECYIDENERLPMMLMEDCLKGTLSFLTAPSESLTRRVYNLAAISFSPADLAAEIKKHIPEFEISYTPDFRQKIAASWPGSLDDSNARKDWSWNHDYDLSKMTCKMLTDLRKKLSA
ncbi:hypothetical protein RCL1_004563 [Eukaryota sp. TZLM3-RCL]